MMSKLNFRSCLIGVVVALVLVVALGVRASTLGILAVAVVCPLMMVAMMKMTMGGKDDSHHDDHPVDNRQSR